ncbi:MAG: hypothetical protein EBX36_08950, partial [Planctomycetia bacterium]|nr:hypothetical protein [Planctomycetia bacterium]
FGRLPARLRRAIFCRAFSALSALFLCGPLRCTVRRPLPGHIRAPAMIENPLHRCAIVGAIRRHGRRGLLATGRASLRLRGLSVRLASTATLVA